MNQEQYQVWLLICDNDVIDMSEALRHDYSVQEFVEHRLKLSGVARATVRSNKRIAAWQNPSAFERQFEVLWEEHVAAIAHAVQRVESLLESCQNQVDRADSTPILHRAAKLLRRVEQILEEPEGRNRLTASQFTRALASLSEIVGNSYCRGKNFVNCTATTIFSSIPDAQAVRLLVAHPYRRYFLVPAVLHVEGTCNRRVHVTGPELARSTTTTT